MSPHRRILLVSYDSKQELRELSADEYKMYVALLDSSTPAAKEHGVVEGAIFGVEGLVFVRREGDPREVEVSLRLPAEVRQKLLSLAKAVRLTPAEYLEHLLEEQPLPDMQRTVPAAENTSWTR
jgi:predicted DNA-binding protein